MTIEVTYFSLDSDPYGNKTKQIGYKQADGTEYVPEGNSVLQISREEFDALEVSKERRVDTLTRTRNLQFMVDAVNRPDDDTFRLPGIFYRNLKKVE